MHAVHPVADEWTEEYIVWAAENQRILLNAPLATFLDVAVTDQVRPVLYTDASASFSPLAALALRRAGGYWAINTGHGIFDGLSGFRIGAFEDLWRDSGTDRERLPGYQRPARDRAGVLMFDIHASARALATTLVGELAEAAVKGLGGTLSRWGRHEPLLESWSVPAVTAAAQAGMPVTGPLHGHGSDGSFVDVIAARTRHGILEQAKGGVVLGAYPTPIAEPIRRASEALVQVVSQFRPTIGFVSLAQFDYGPVPGAGPTQVAGPVQGATGKVVEVPLAVLLGPRAVHDLQLDPSTLGDRHDVTMIGPPKMPSALVRFSDPDAGLWAQLMAFAYDLGPQRVAAAAGIGPVT